METGVGKGIWIILLSLVMLAVSGCATMDSAEDAMDGIAWGVVDLAYEHPELIDGRVLAVYYFTEEGEESEISDHLIEMLTSLLARGVREEGIDLKIVSRQVLDRIMKEYEFQLSSLVDESTQSQLGKLLGADLILSGTIQTIDGDYRINAQLVDVQSGAVLDGYLYDFWMD